MVFRLLFTQNKENSRTRHCSFGYALFTERAGHQFELDVFRFSVICQMQAINRKQTLHRTVYIYIRFGGLQEKNAIEVALSKQ